MKIKQKKQLDLPQLIEWAAKNKIKNQIFRADKQLMNVEFYKSGDFETFGFTGIDTIFTVEVEEKINEDTEFEFLILIEDFNPKFISPKRNKSINEAGVNRACTLEIHAYIDGEFKLIWTRDKGVMANG
jgi:hypothetical protein